MTATAPSRLSRLTELSPDVAGLQGRRAGFVTRGVAYSIDALVVITGVPAILFGLAVVQGLLRFEAPVYPPDIPDWLTATISGLWGFWYFVGLWWATGRTLGAALMGVRVVGRTKDHVGVIRAAIRWWVMVLTLFVVGPVWLAVSRSRLALHDRAAHTQVVYDSATKRSEIQVALAPERAAGASGDQPK